MKKQKEHQWRKRKVPEMGYTGTTQGSWTISTYMEPLVATNSEKMDKKGLTSTSVRDHSLKDDAS